MLTTNYRHNMKLRCSLWGKPSWCSWNGIYARQHSFSKEAKLLKEGLPSSSLLSISDSQFPVSKICGAFKMLSGQNCWTWLINLTEVATSYLVKSSEQSCSPCLASIDSCVESMATHPGCWNSSFLDLSLPALSPTPSETSYHQGSDSGLHPKTALGVSSCEFPWLIRLPTCSAAFFDRAWPAITDLAHSKRHFCQESLHQNGSPMLLLNGARAWENAWITLVMSRYFAFAFTVILGWISVFINMFGNTETQPWPGEGRSHLFFSVIERMRLD